MSKTVSGTTEGYVWDTAEGLPTILQDGTTRYVTGPDGLPIEQIDGAGTVLYYDQDQLGSTRGLLNSSGQVVAAYWYDTYGTRHVVTGTATTTPFGYAGQYTDAETGFQYLRARSYDPATQQFLSVAPLASQTWLPYAYTMVDPLNAVDPLGLGQCSWSPGDWGSCLGTAWSNTWNGIKASSRDYVHSHPDAYQGPGYQAARYLWPWLPSSATSSASPQQFPCPMQGYAPGFGSVQEDGNDLLNPNIPRAWSKIPYDRTLLKRSPTSEDNEAVTARDPLCRYCGANSETSDHEPSLKTRWTTGEYDGNTLNEINSDAADRGRMVGACRSCNASKQDRPIGTGQGQWDPRTSPRNRAKAARGDRVPWDDQWGPNPDQPVSPPSVTVDPVDPIPFPGDVPFDPLILP